MLICIVLKNRNCQVKSRYKKGGGDAGTAWSGGEYWANKEDMDKKSYCTNPLTEAHFYGDRYAITNNTSVEQTTIFYDMDGLESKLTLSPYEIKWIMKS